MNTNSKKIKRIHSRNDEGPSRAKRQFRNETEKRRRDLFTQLIMTLKELLSIKKISSLNEDNHKLDKGSILREVVIYLQKHHQNVTTEVQFALSNLKNPSPYPPIDFSWKPPCDLITNEEWLKITIESMNCFFLVIKADLYQSKIKYISENIASYLGYSQNEIIDRLLFEFILPSHHDQLLLYLINNHQVLETCDISWKRAGCEDYEQCSIIGAFRNSTTQENEKYLMSIVKINTLDRTVIMHIEDPPEELITHLNLQGKFIYVDSKTQQFLGYNSMDLIGRTFFDFIHPDDLPIIVRAHQLWKENGHGTSDPYRFLTKGQQWIFLQTSSQVCLNSWTGKPETYICTTTAVQGLHHSLQSHLSNGSTNAELENSKNDDFDLNQSNFCFNSTDYTSLSTTTATTATIAASSFPQEKLSPPFRTEITAFLSHLRKDEFRKHILEKLIERRQIKQDEIRTREEEIEVIDDVLRSIDQYQSKRLTNQIIKVLNSEDIPSRNGSNTTGNSNVFHSPFNGVIEHSSIPKNTTDDLTIDPLALLFSPSSSPTFNLSSPMTPFSNPSLNNDFISDTNYLPSTTNSSQDGYYLQNPFS